MNAERSFERFVADHVAGAPTPVHLPDDFYHDVHAMASRTRQRPEWLALIKEPPMRIDHKLGVGSPIARVAVFAVTTLLLALLGVGALVAGAQSPSPSPVPEPPSFFTGSGPTDACLIAEPSSESVDGVIRERGESWGCLSWMTDDARFSGVAKAIWNMDAVTIPGGSNEIIAARQRIENEAGAWEGTLTEIQAEGQGHMSAGWFIGEGAYDGLAAYVIHDIAGGDRMWGVVMPEGLAAPAAFVED